MDITQNSGRLFSCLLYSDFFFFSCPTSNSVSFPGGVFSHAHSDSAVISASQSSRCCQLWKTVPFSVAVTLFSQRPVAVTHLQISSESAVQWVLPVIPESRLRQGDVPVWQLDHSVTLLYYGGPHAKDSSHISSAFPVVHTISNKFNNFFFY